MLDIKGLDIYVSRGDTATIVFDYEDDVPPDGTIAVITLTRFAGSSTALWVKNTVVENGSSILRLTSQDTSFIPGTYKYGLRFFYQDEEIFTPMWEPAKFIILEAN